MVIGLVHVFLPYMVLPIYTVLLKIDPGLIEAATDLGASRFKAFLKVTLPLSLSGVMSGILMVFLPAATTLVIPKYLGNNVFLIGNLIERVSILSGNIGYGASIAIVLSVIMMAMILLVRRLDKFKGPKMTENKVTTVLKYVFIVLILAIIYFPVFSMIFFSFNANKSFTRFGGFSFKWYIELFNHKQMMNAVLVTIVVALISTFFSTIIGTLAAISLSRQKKVLRNLTLNATNIPIINPEIITAISLFVLFGIFFVPSGYLTMILAHIAFLHRM